jgi:hypothetical protein
MLSPDTKTRHSVRDEGDNHGANDHRKLSPVTGHFSGHIVTGKGRETPVRQVKRDRDQR